MTIEEAILQLKSLVNMNMCPNLFNQTIKWLEELEQLRAGGEKIAEELKNQSFVDNQLNRVVDLDEAIEIIKAG